MNAKLHDAIRTATAADDAWSAELVARFGKDAGDARYQRRGEGEPGSPLRMAYDARQDAVGLMRMLYADQ